MYYNKCIFIGRLTRDPVMRVTPSGIAVTTFTLAVNRPFTNGKGEREADFIRVVTWRKLAETVADNLSKGRLVLVEGRLQVGTTYTDREGIQRKSFDIVADVVRFLDRKKETEGAPAGVPEADTSADVPDSGVPSDLPEIDWPEEPPF